MSAQRPAAAATRRYAGHRPTPATDPPCPNRAAHSDARGWAHAARKSRTHQQRQCPDCGLWVIWTPLPPGSLVTCWHCSARNVDPATLGEDDGVPDEPICAGCRAAEAVRLEAARVAGAAASLVRQWAEAT